LPHPQIKLIQKENGGKHTAMNEALKNIETELIGSLDADSFVDSKALKFIALHFKKENVAAVTSVIKTEESKNI
jgi:cellulose synthase/poly-beta-1,6-N-acetylglucosamine synthase-like glycosyltransferase